MPLADPGNHITPDNLFELDARLISVEAVLTGSTNGISSSAPAVDYDEERQLRSLTWDSAWTGDPPMSHTSTFLYDCPLD